MIANSTVNEWLSSQPQTAGIYDLIEKANIERSSKERIRAIIALGSSGDPRAVRSLIDCCQDQNPEIRLYAIEGLHSLRSGRATVALIERLRDKEELPVTRQRAAAALANIRGNSAIAELRNRYADTEEDGALRSFIGGELDLVKIR